MEMLSYFRGDKHEFCLVVIKFKHKAELHVIPYRDDKVVRISYKPCLTKSLICGINRKNYLYSKFHRRYASANEFNYNAYKNKLTGILRNARKAYYYNQYDDANNNIKHTRTILSYLLNNEFLLYAIQFC